MYHHIKKLMFTVRVGTPDRPALRLQVAAAVNNHLFMIIQ